MTRQILAPLRLTGKLLLAAVAVATVAAPILFGPIGATQLNAQSEQPAPTLAYDVVSIKPIKTLSEHGGMRSTPDGLMLMNIPLSNVIASAYSVRMYRIPGMPAWLTSDPYDLQAKMGDAALAEFQKLSKNDQMNQRFRMLQPVLEDR